MHGNVKRVAAVKKEKPRSIVHDWRHLFTPAELAQGKKFAEEGKFGDFYCTDHEAEVTIGSGSGRYKAWISFAPVAYSMGWSRNWFNCTCGNFYPNRGRSSYYYRGVWEEDRHCSHTAALLFLWEQKHGEWYFEESDEEREARIRAEKEELERQRREKIRVEEEAKREKQKAIEGERIYPVNKFLTEQGGFGKNLFFDLGKASFSVRTNLYAVNRAKKLLPHNAGINAEFSIIYGSDGEQRLKAEMAVEDEVIEGRIHETSIVISRDAVEKKECECEPKRVYYGYFARGDLSTEQLCEHELVLLSRINDYVNAENPGDATDRAAMSFFEAMEDAPVVQDPAAVHEKTKSADLFISPMITIEKGQPYLSFRVGEKGSKPLLLKKLGDFSEAYEREQFYSLGKNLAIDFSQRDFEEASKPWLNFVMQKVDDADKASNRLSRRSWYSSVRVNAQNKELLEGALLDRFYDLAEGGTCEMSDKSRRSGSYEIVVGHKAMNVSVATKKITDSSGDIIGVELSGRMPVMLKGTTESYILDDHALSRISKDEERALKPFKSASDSMGNIHFKVGKDRLAEFYYRIVPMLIEQSYVDLQDDLSEAVAPMLPPEPEFTFYIDAEDDITCKTVVSYEGTEYILAKERQKSDGYRDIAQENRVIKCLEKYFTESVENAGIYATLNTSDEAYRLLSEGVPELSHYGKVMGSDSFNRLKIKSSPQFKLNVSIDSGVMDLELLSKDVSPEELLDVLMSYEKRKKYHVLRNGEFVTLAGNDQLDSLLDLTKSMDIDIKEFAKGKMELPSYRALYLDKLLEEHDAIVSSRDRTYRALIKNFQTVKDADYEVPESMTEVLRPYQTYGFKWLKTLQEAGFGGILADEMGLGKTVQAIALFKSWHDEGLKAPVLVVCPASLVFNWQEEIRRFAPEIPVETLAGNAANRKEVTKRIKKPGKEGIPEVVIISYDLLRRDISHLDKVPFHAVFLDEAQYIKNQKAGMTKAVKGVQASYRYALTGTPIENRLAELWSIFDFLMPGFLYDYGRFSNEFEVPIVKSKDKNASEKLKRMVRPFILRRLKTEVLKDLPEKLEEVRYARFDGEQKKVYDGQVVLMKGLIGTGGRKMKAGEEKIKILAELMRLREICCDPSLILEDYAGGSAKRQACMDLIESAIEGGHRMLLFSQFTSMLELLEKDLKERKIEYYKITGQTPKDQRLRLVHKFNEGDVPVFLISLKAGGTGLNLTGADVVIHYDPWWNLAVQNQATDRAHRIGQTKKVTVYRMIAKDTIEEKILALQEAKKDLADEILSGEGKSLMSLSSEELLELLG